MSVELLGLVGVILSVVMLSVLRTLRKLEERIVELEHRPDNAAANVVAGKKRA